MRRILLPLLVALPLLGQLPPGMSRMHFRPDFYAWQLRVTADDTMWVLPFANQVAARVDIHGVAYDFDLPGRWILSASGVGPDGALWLGAHGNIARVDPITGVMKTWAIGAGHTPSHILAGPDGNLWFVEQKGRVVRMRTDGEFLATYEAGGNANGAAFGSDGALYLAMETKIVRMTVDGQQTARPATTKYAGFAGRDFFWHGGRSVDEPERKPEGTITKTSFRGETLATYQTGMTPLASDASGNLWLRAVTDEGDIVGRLTPSGVLTRFGPLPSLPSIPCHEWWYAGMAFLSDGRVAMADHYPDIPVSLPSPPPPCYGVRRPADFKNTITIFDPSLAPVLSVESLHRTPRRRSVRR